MENESLNIAIEKIRQDERQKTLKAVGVWLDSINFSDYDIQGVIASFQHYSVEALKEGRIPDE